jgi:hypothetical protein
MSRRRPSVTTVIACMALFFALGGSALAASKYLITSRSQIKPSVLKSLQGSKGAAGKAGPPGPAGAAGAAGAVGTFNASTLAVVDGPAVSISSDSTGTSTAVCPTGDTAISGGYAGPLANTTVTFDDPLGTTEWQVGASNLSANAETLTAVVVCVA